MRSHDLMSPLDRSIENTEQPAGDSTAESDTASTSTPMGGSKIEPVPASFAPTTTMGGGGDVASGNGAVNPAKVAVEVAPQQQSSNGTPAKADRRLSSGKRSMFASMSNKKSPAPKPDISYRTSPALCESISNSAPTVLIRTTSSSDHGELQRPIRSIMSSRTLHESLHRGLSSKDCDKRRPDLHRSVSFAQVNIREYERVLGDNPSVRAGPPLSIGWRYAPDPITMDLEDYEEGKGLSRSSAEYLVPKAVREQMLREHAGVSRREIVGAVRTIQKDKAQRRKTVVNLNMQPLEEKMEGAKRKIKKTIKPSTRYEVMEAKLWDDAHAAAVEKARRLEESIRKGESVSTRDLYRVGTPYNNIMPSRRNLMTEVSGGLEPVQSVSDEGGSSRNVSLDEIAKQHAMSPMAKNDQPPPSTPQPRRFSPGGTEKPSLAATSQQVGGGAPPKDDFRPSIVVSEVDDDDILANLVLDDSCIGQH